MEDKGNLELKNAGLKVTGPRLKILKMFESSEEQHLSAEEIYRSLIESGDDVGLATVYRVLSQFEAADLIVKHQFETGHAVFELNQGEHHDHLICVRCGQVKEFVDEQIEARQEKIAEQFQFKMTDHALNIYGVCAKCNQG